MISDEIGSEYVSIVKLISWIKFERDPTIHSVQLWDRIQIQAPVLEKESNLKPETTV